MENVKTSFWVVKSKANKSKYCPIYMRIHYRKQNVNLSTGHYIHPSKWDKKRRLAIGMDRETVAINRTLNLLRAKVILIVNQLNMENRPINVQAVKSGGNSKGASC